MFLLITYNNLYKPAMKKFLKNLSFVVDVKLDVPLLTYKDAIKNKDHECERDRKYNINERNKR